MQQTRGDDLRRNAQVRENAGDSQTMVDIGLARVAFLFTMSFFCDSISAVDQLSVGESVIVRKLFEQSFKWNGCFGSFHRE
jgi:hypothetical protein